MIDMDNISKSFDGVYALKKITVTIKPGTIWGLLGINGAGKSTLLKIIAGILRPDSGKLMFNEKVLFDNRDAKREVFYLPDDPYYFPNATVGTMASYYASLYPEFNQERFGELYEALGFDDIRKIRTFSKGMKRQIFILLAICANTKYLLCDEIFDGLDPIMRNTIQELLQNEVHKNGLTLLMASHNLKELDDFCSNIGIIHQGGILLSKELEQMKGTTHKFQCVLKEEGYQGLKESLELISVQTSGFVVTLLARGEKTQMEKEIAAVADRYEELPLTIEEIFMHESEVAGYDINAILS